MSKVVILFLLSFVIAGCTLGGVDVEQEDASGVAGELLDGHSFGQTFTPQYDGLYRIDLYTATYGRENTHPVLFRILPSPPQGEGQGRDDLVHLELAAAEISNSGPTVITFPPLLGTAGHTLYFAIESPGSAGGDAITIYRQEEDAYAGGQMYVDGEPVGGDVAFIAYTRETFTFGDIWRDFYSRASQDGPFFIFYGSLVGALSVALVIMLVWPLVARAKYVVARSGGDEAPPDPAEGDPLAPLAMTIDADAAASAEPSEQPIGSTSDSQRAGERASFFLTLLAVAVLTQLFVLRWQAVTVLFVTWFVLTLIVRHDSRISAAIGLALLTLCPFLLIAKRDAAAEQAANYAYFFLAIGVLVQLEELVLERYHWLDRKLDLSYLWRPVTETLLWGWSRAWAAFEMRLVSDDPAGRVRLGQTAGAAGLVLVLLLTLSGDVSIFVLLPLLGGAVVVPLVVWGTDPTARAVGTDWLLHMGLRLIVVSSVVVTTVWLSGLSGRDQLVRMDTTYDFIEHWEEAKRIDPAAEGESIQVVDWTIGDRSQRVLFQHPAFTGASRLGYTVTIPAGAVLAFDVAIAPESWDKPGDGASFSIYVETTDGTEQLFSTYIDPKHDEADRLWHTHTLELGVYTGQTVTLVFETGAGPAGDYQYDWAGWGTPSLLAP